MQTSLRPTVIDLVSSHSGLWGGLILAERNWSLDRGHFLTSLPKGADAASDLSHNRHSVVHLASSWPPLSLSGWMWTFKSKPHTHTHTGMNGGREAHTLFGRGGRRKKWQLRLFIIKTPCHTEDVWMCGQHAAHEEHINKQRKQNLSRDGREQPHAATPTGRRRGREKHFKRLDRGLSHFEPRR